MTGENATLELALRKAPEAVMLTPAQIMVIASTEFVPKSMRGNVSKVLACIARGRAMGIPDMVAVNGIDIIEGKATLSAELMVAIVREHGHSITGDVTADRAVVHGKRRDNGDTMSAEFNREMAETAGLLGKANWKKHPDDMMWARAVSKLCRRLFADCFAGGTYAPDDLEPTADETQDEVAGLTEPVDQPTGVSASSPGSASPDTLEAFKAWRVEQDIPALEVAQRSVEMYGRVPDQAMTPDELARLARSLLERQEALGI